MRFAALALLVLLGTAACAPTPPPPVPGVPTTTPDVEAPAVFTIVLGSTAVNLLDKKGKQVDSFEYAEPDATPLVAALNTAFGAAVVGVPLDTETLYSWDGLQLQDFADTDDPSRSGIRINVVKPTVAGVDIEVTGGVGIGSASSAVEPLADDSRVDDRDGINIRVFLLGATEGASVELWADEPDGHVYNILAGQTAR